MKKNILAANVQFNFNSNHLFRMAVSNESAEYKINTNGDELDSVEKVEEKSQGKESLKDGEIC